VRRALAVGLPSGWIDGLSYPGRPDVAVWLTGCPTRADNGWVRADDIP
jgi:hypothetical protein